MVRTLALRFCDCFVDACIYSDCTHLLKDKELKDCDISNCSFPADSYSKPICFLITLSLTRIVNFVTPLVRLPLFNQNN